VQPGDGRGAASRDVQHALVDVDAHHVLGADPASDLPSDHAGAARHIEHAVGAREFCGVGQARGPGGEQGWNELRLVDLCRLCSDLT